MAGERCRRLPLAVASGSRDSGGAWSMIAASMATSVVRGRAGRAGDLRGAERRLRLTARERPNIVLIVADDLGWGDVGFNGRTEWSTPNLDRWRRQGRVFERCYTAAVVCAPSRAAFLTGKYTIHSGVRRNDDDLPAEEVTIAEALKPLGYTTALFGKWHHGKPRVGQERVCPPDGPGIRRVLRLHRRRSMPGRSFRPSFGTAASRFRSRDTSTT